MTIERTPEEHVAALLRELPPAPEGWIRAAQELPEARAAIDTIVARAEQGLAARQAVIADLEAALAAEGVEARPGRVAELRRRLEGSG